MNFQAKRREAARIAREKKKAAAEDPPNTTTTEPTAPVKRTAPSTSPANGSSVTVGTTRPTAIESPMKLLFEAHAKPKGSVSSDPNPTPTSVNAPSANGDAGESKPKRVRKKKEIMIINDAPNPMEPKTPLAGSTPTDDEKPPKWFTKYAEGIFQQKNPDNEPKARKMGRDYAKKQWEKPYVRDRFSDAVGTHASDMYSLIFSS